MVASWPLSRVELHWLDGKAIRYCVKLEASLGNNFQPENTNGENAGSGKEPVREGFRIRMGKVGWRISELSAENAHLLREGNQITTLMRTQVGWPPSFAD